ncbi:MAG: hypothetical protein BV456_03580 [Thermoplasmata archaeon M8B2D]|nr:MAG: hypothetical protein BV456_03580 [Thermoplasmata archaeon M8B2D]
MTREEIKSNNSLKDIALRYGIKVNKKGFCCCVFHNEKTPSMQIKEKTFTCFGCGEHGDIFDFVMKMDNCDFKDAFLSLGGTYENTENDFAAKMRLEKMKREREKRKLIQIRHEKQRYDICTTISYFRSLLDKQEPLSDMWCIAQNNLIFLNHIWEEKYIKKNEVNISGIIGKYSGINFNRDITR